MVFLESTRTTSIENRYGTSPDERESFLISAADPFTEEDLLHVEGKVCHVNPLWYGEFPEELITKLREKVDFLSGDAQGFVRAPENGKLVYRDWRKKEHLRFFDLFKVDIKEAAVLTGTKDLKDACRIIGSFGTRIVLATHSAGVLVFDGEFHEAPLKDGLWRGEQEEATRVQPRFSLLFSSKE